MRCDRSIILFAAGVAELVDALDLGSSGATRAGSSPVARTWDQQPKLIGPDPASISSAEPCNLLDQRCEQPPKSGCYRYFVARLATLYRSPSHWQSRSGVPDSGDGVFLRPDGSNTAIFAPRSRS